MKAKEALEVFEAWMKERRLMRRTRGTIQELMELLGHTNITTTEIYLHCLPSLASRVSSPLDNVTQFRRSA